MTGLLQKNVKSAIQRGQKLDDIEDRAGKISCNLNILVFNNGSHNKLIKFTLVDVN